MKTLFIYASQNWEWTFNSKSAVKMLRGADGIFLKQYTILTCYTLLEMPVRCSTLKQLKWGLKEIIGTGASSQIIISPKVKSPSDCML